MSDYDILVDVDSSAYIEIDIETAPPGTAIELMANWAGSITEAEVTTLVNAAKAQLVNGASPTMDQFNEVEEALVGKEASGTAAAAIAAHLAASDPHPQYLKIADMRPALWGVTRPETRALLDYYYATGIAEPPSGVTALLDRLIYRLVTAGVWAKLNPIYVPAVHDMAAAMINIRQPGTFSLAPSGTLEFSPMRGVRGDGASGQLVMSGLNAAASPLVAGGTVSLSAYVTEGTGTDAVIAPPGSGGRFWLIPRGSSGSMLVRLHDSSGVDVGAVPSRSGMFVASRTAADTVQGMHNGVALSPVSNAAEVAASDALALLCRGTIYANDRVRFAAFGAGLSVSEMAALSAAVTAFVTDAEGAI